MTPTELDTITRIVLAIITRYAPPPLPIAEYRRRVAEAEREKRDPARVTMLRLHELNQSILQAMQDPEWKRHPVLSRAFFDAGACVVKVDGVEIEVIPWAERLAAHGMETAHG